jgi:hypothetical protein
VLHARHTTAREDACTAANYSITSSARARRAGAHRGNAMDGGKIDEPLSLKEKHLTRKF